jgi:ribosomal protein S18 acetylase RimI-like enzyme
MALIRRAGAGDLPSVVGIHERAFSGFFMTELGPAFLERYYGEVLAYPGGILLVAEEDAATVGFVAGFCNPGGFYRTLRRHVVPVGLAMLPAMCRRPMLLRRVVSNFRRAGDVVREPLHGGAELSSLAVDPAVGRRGAGKALVEKFVDHAAAKGASMVYLTTDAKGNDAVKRFYVSLGFGLVRTFVTAQGRLMDEMRLPLPGSGVMCARDS